MRVLQALLGLAEQAIEFLRGREDWNRTWSPASFWLAVAMFGFLVLMGVAYGHEVWVWFRAWAWRPG